MHFHQQKGNYVIQLTNVRSALLPSMLGLHCYHYQIQACALSLFIMYIIYGGLCVSIFLHMCVSLSLSVSLSISLSVSICVCVFLSLSPIDSKHTIGLLSNRQRIIRRSRLKAVDAVLLCLFASIVCETDLKKSFSCPTSPTTTIHTS